MLGVEQSAKRYTALPSAIPPKVTSIIHGACEYACKRFSDMGLGVNAASQSKNLSLVQAFKVLPLKLVASASTSDDSIL